MASFPKPLVFDNPNIDEHTAKLSEYRGAFPLKRVVVWEGGAETKCANKLQSTSCAKVARSDTARNFESAMAGAMTGSTSNTGAAKPQMAGDLAETFYDSMY